MLYDASSDESSPTRMYDQLQPALAETGFFLPERAADGFMIATKSLEPATRSQMCHILVIEEKSSYQLTLAKSLLENLHSSSFDCYIQPLHAIRPSAENSGLVYIFLPETQHPILENLSSDSFSMIQQTFASAKGLLWLTKQDENGVLAPGRAMIDGLARVVRAENDQAVFVTAALEMESTESSVNSITTLIKNIDFGSTEKSYEPEYRQREGQFYIGRMIEAKDATQQVLEKSLPFHSKKLPLKECPPLRMAIGSPGLLDTLHFVEDVSYYEDLAVDEVEIKVDVIGLNFKDLLLALGRVDGTTFGHECAGIVTRVGANVILKPGDRVCAVSATAFSTFSRVKVDLVARVPDALSLEHAVCVPTQLCVSYHGIRNISKLKAGESILIHSGAGGTGQWAIQVAQQLGAEVFATVGSDEKKRFLIEHYQIPEDHIFSSRNTLFASSILRMTNNRGVDVVLNSLAGESLLASWNIIAPYGRFIELGRKDISENANLPMRPFTRGATFMALEISSLAHDEPTMVSKNIEAIFDELVDGRFRPIEPLKVMTIEHVEKSMRMLQEGNMIGKIVLKMTDESVVPVSSMLVIASHLYRLTLI